MSALDVALVGTGGRKLNKKATEAALLDVLRVCRALGYK